MLNKTYTAVLGVAVGATALAGAVSLMPSASATTGTGAGAASSTATVTVPSSCTMSGGQEHSKTIYNGQLEDIGTSTLNVMCNDSGGFAIYAVGFGNNKIGNTVLHSDTQATTYDIQTGTSGTNSYWSMKLAKVTGNYEMTVDPAFDQTAHVVPDAYTKVAQRTATTDFTEGSSVNATYSAYVSQTQPQGTYTGKVKYVLIHPSGTTPPTTFVMQDVDYWKETMLEGETYKVTDNRDNKEYYVSKLEDGNVWMTSNLDLCIGCSGTAALTSENTDLNTAGSGIYATDYSTDSNGVIHWTPVASHITPSGASTNNTLTGSPAQITNFAKNNPANSVSGWQNSYVMPYMAEGGNHWVANNNPYNSYADCVSANGADLCNQKFVGNYYNWTAAVASSDSTNISAKFATAENSICPKGWRLSRGPDGTHGSEFNTLLSAANIAAGIDPGTGSGDNVGYKPGGLEKMEGLPYAFGRFGGVGGTTFYNLSANGYYWSGSTVSSERSFYLYYNASALYPAAQLARGNGWSVRCVAR